MTTMARPDRRQLDYAHDEAKHWLAEYARLARENNAPDDEHTRCQIMGLAQEAVEQEFGE